MASGGSGTSGASAGSCLHQLPWRRTWETQRLLPATVCSPGLTGVGGGHSALEMGMGSCWAGAPRAQKEGSTGKACSSQEPYCSFAVPPPTLRPAPNHFGHCAPTPTAEPVPRLPSHHVPATIAAAGCSHCQTTSPSDPLALLKAPITYRIK